VLLLTFFGILTIIIFILNLELFRLKKCCSCVVYTEEEVRLYCVVASGEKL
jgi:hypothetical protein